MHSLLQSMCNAIAMGLRHLLTIAEDNAGTILASAAIHVFLVAPRLTWRVPQGPKDKAKPYSKINALKLRLHHLHNGDWMRLHKEMLDSQNASGAVSGIAIDIDVQARARSRSRCCMEATAESWRPPGLCHRHSASQSTGSLTPTFQAASTQDFKFVARCVLEKMSALLLLLRSWCVRASTLQL